MLALPVSSSPLREMFSVADLATLGSAEGRCGLATFQAASAGAKATFAQDTAVRSVNSVCIRANGELWLVTFGPKGGWKRLWNFGTL